MEHYARLRWHDGTLKDLYAALIFATLDRQCPCSLEIGVTGGQFVLLGRTSKFWQPILQGSGFLERFWKSRACGNGVKLSAR